MYRFQFVCNSFSSLRSVDRLICMFQKVNFKLENDTSIFAWLSSSFGIIPHLVFYLYQLALTQIGDDFGRSTPSSLFFIFVILLIDLPNQYLSSKILQSQRNRCLMLMSNLTLIILGHLHFHILSQILWLLVNNCPLGEIIIVVY